MKEIAREVEKRTGSYPQITTDAKYLEEEKKVLLSKGLSEEVIDKAQKFAVKEAYRETEKAT